MGHTRLGQIPKSRKWDSVVGLILESMDTGTLLSDIGKIADQTIDAARGGLERGAKDPGLIYTVFLLMQLSVAGRSDLSLLGSIGFEVTETDSVYDLLDQVQLNIDEYISNQGGSTDYSEIAQKAAGSALLQALEPEATSLFGTGPDELRNALKKISTSSGFASLAQDFFGDYLSRFLNFYLSRITARAMGYSEFRQLDEFNKELHVYSKQSARVISDFAGAWLSKTLHEERLSEDTVKRFLCVANKKLSAELATAKRTNNGAT